MSITYHPSFGSSGGVRGLSITSFLISSGILSTATPPTTLTSKFTPSNGEKPASLTSTTYILNFRTVPSETLIRPMPTGLELELISIF
jgi:hypothetical protein